MITITADTTVIGELHSKGRICVDGHVEGHGYIEGMVLLTPHGHWRGSVAADIVIIHGTVDGDIVARAKLELHPQARVTGNVASPAILIKPGARISATVLTRATAPLRLVEDKTPLRVPAISEKVA